MSVSEKIVNEAIAHDVVLYLKDGHLAYSSAGKGFPDALRKKIATHREAIIGYLAELDARASVVSVADAGIRPRQEGERLPLSFAQNRLWFLSQLGEASAAYHIPAALRLRGELDESALRQALDALWQRHESLRTVFQVVEGQPQVKLLPVTQPFPLLDHDLGEAGDGAAALAVISEEEAHAPFDLAAGPLVRGRLVRMGSNDHALLLTQHHIVSDGWSLGILVNEFSALYAAFVEGRDNPLPPLAVQYPDYAVWQRQWMTEERLGEQLDYWERSLSGAPDLLSLPTDRPRPATPSFVGGSMPVRLDAELTVELMRLSQRHGATLFTTLLTAWASVLGHLSGQDDVVIGTPSANRGRHEIEPLVGFFVNTLALRIDLSDAPTVSQLLLRAHTVALSAQDHQDVPFEQVVERLNPPRRLDHTSLFQVMFTWHNNERGDLALPGLQIESLSLAADRCKFDLTLDMTLNEPVGTIEGVLSYATDLFDASTVERYTGYLVQALRGMVTDATQPMARIDLLSPEERARLLVDFNATEAICPLEKSLDELIEIQVGKSPEAIAFIHGDRQVTYRQFNGKANTIARQLGAMGISQGDIVPVLMEGSLEVPLSYLAIMKAGAAFAPLDINWPVERLELVLSMIRPKVILVDEKSPVDSTDYAAFQKIICLDDVEVSGNLQIQHHPEMPIYVIHTSGSTGKPKGAVNLHRGIVNRLCFMSEYFDDRADEVVLQTTNHCFDSAVWQYFWPLIKGGTSVIPIFKDNLFDVSEVARAMTKYSVTTTDFTPALLDLLCDFFCSSPDADGSRMALRRIIVGGDKLTRITLTKFMNHFPWVKVYNFYGPSETSIGTICHELSGSVDEIIPIGKPISNTSAIIVNKDLNLVPIGSVGELLLGGVCIGGGYLSNPQETRRNFIPNAFPELAGDTLYKTGDLARHRNDGVIEYLGRIDNQIKIRGFRIELGEIESLLVQHPEVREAVVLAREDVAGDKHLVAYVTTQAVTVIDALDLRRHLARLLPDHMVPSAFVRMDALPLTANGKLDRKSLPAPEDSALAHHAYAAPEGELEQLLADVWSELLGVETIGRYDNFFELGGHSMLAIKLMERLRRLGLSPEIRDVFAKPTLADLAQALGGHREVVVPPNLITTDTRVLTPALLPLIELTQDDVDRIVAQVPGGVRAIQDIYALSPLQEGILFHHLLAEQGDPYLLYSQVAFADRALLDRYLAALKQVIDRHDILRTAFFWDGLSLAAQVVLRHVPLSVTELTLDAKDGPIEVQLAERYDPRRYRIDLSEAPLLRVVVAYDQSARRWVALHLQHHLLGDHSTQDVIREELIAFLDGKSEALPAPQPFRNLVAQAKYGVDETEHEAFFREQLSDIDEPTLPFGIADVYGDGSAIVQSHQRLSASLNERLRRHGRRLGVSVASLCHLAWGQVVARTSGRESVVFGTVLFGRMHGGEGADRAMGLFMNSLPFRLDLGEQSVEDSVRTAHACLANLLNHEHASLALAQHCSGVDASAPLFSALLNYRHIAAIEVDQETSSLVGIEWLGGEERTNYPISFSVEDYGDALGLTAQVVDTLSAERICAYMEQALESLVDALDSAPHSPMRMLEIMPTAERMLLLNRWNDTATSFPSDPCLHHLFEARAAEEPDAIAIQCDGKTISYAALNTRANRLAKALLDRGVRPDDRVAICVDRSFAMVEGLLGILKAGAAYLPLDPAYPSARLQSILDDADPVLLLCDEVGRAVLGSASSKGRELIALDGTDTGASLPVEPDVVVPSLTPSHLAYVIYTSGSTGTPKGVMVEHRSVVNFVRAMSGMLQFEQGERCLAMTSMSFDIAALEIYLPLAMGSTIILATRREITDLEVMGRLVNDQCVTVMQATPTVWRAMTSGEWSTPLGMTKLCGGEALPAELGRRLLENAAAVWNVYGPTETTIWSSAARVTADTAGTVIPIGRPICNTRFYLLNDEGQPVPLGAVGELYIGGDGVGRGYLNRPELTAERFLADPFAPSAGMRMYRTGDLARYLPDGNLVFMGRNDHQVKLRGFRIELGEIEARLSEHGSVRDAVAVALGDGADKRLVAYVVAEADEGLVSSLRSHLVPLLPDYMVPSAFVVLDAMPLTPNGKLDRKALPAPGDEALAHRRYEAPEGEVETALAEIWQELLGVEQVGRHDNFFELGGHSLLAVRLLSRLKLQFSVQLPLVELFIHATLRELAGAIVIRQSSDMAVTDPIVPTPRDGELPLSFAQKRLWFLSQLGEASAAYHIPAALR
ncbi:non-ribosomal peptide synthetase, partial [Rhodanobacter sp. MP1X3]|uniref:non-ribosomal peptide synthetase n=1 Tax=Rhodanobacter sp. MP1X3 TaxID=2723086 RepID=UPI00161545E9